MHARFEMLRIVAVLWGVQVMGESIVTPDAACHFIGSRFAKVASVCHHGVCTSIRRDKDGTFSIRQPESEPVTCEAAVKEFLDFLSKRKPRVRKERATQEMTVNKIRRYVDESIVPALDQMNDGLDSSSERFAEAAATFDEWTLRLASDDWGSWSESIVPLVTNSSEWKEMEIAYLRLHMLWMGSSYLDHQQEDWLTTALLFYFDFVALFGKHLFEAHYVARIGLAVYNAVPWYRRLDSREAKSKLSAGVPATPADIVSLAGSIDRVSRGETRDADLIRLALLFKAWQDDVPSASRAMIEHQISNSVCPDLKAVVASFRVLPGQQEQIKVGIALVDFCHGVVPRADLRVAVRALASIQYQTETPMLPPFAGQVVEFLRNDTLPWGLGLHIDEQWPLSRIFTATSLLEDFITTVVPQARAGRTDRFPLNAFAKSGHARAFGRAVGLCITHESDVGGLPIPAAVAQLFHPRFRLDVLSKDDFYSRLDSTHVDVFFAVQAGIEESLGPGGFYLYSQDEWIALFKPKPALQLA